MHEVWVFAALQVGLILGFVLGRRTGHAAEPHSSATTPAGLRRETQEKLKAVKIDEARFVTKVADDSLKSQGTSLGKSSSVEDDIGSSVNKLAQLKRGRQ